MQYILSEEEYKSLIPSQEYERMRNSLLDENAKLENIINRLKSEVVKDRLCIDKGDQSYCDGCVLGFEGLNLCTSNKKSYSKMKNYEQQRT